MYIKVKLALVVCLVLFIGCDEKKPEQKTQTNDTQESLNIEVVTNKNPKEIKVEEKEKTKLQTKNGKAYYYDYNIKSEYDPNSQPANKDASVRVKPRTKTDAQLRIRSPYENVGISLLVRKLSHNFIVKCSACHNDYANGIIGPSLLHKTSDQILKSINEFKTGVKSNPLMDDLIKLMDEDELKEIANEIQEFNKKIEKLKGIK
jgi:cytochrome c553